VGNLLFSTGDQRIGKGNGDQQPQPDQSATVRQHRPDPKAIGQPITGKPAQGHGDHIGNESQCSGIGVGMNGFSKINTAPIEHRAFTGHGGKRDQSIFGQCLVGQGKPGPALARGRLLRHAARIGIKTESRQQYSYDQKMPCGRHREPDHEGTQGRAPETGKAPDAMKASNNRPVEEGLYANRLGVDRNIEQVARRSETKRSTLRRNRNHRLCFIR